MIEDGEKNRDKVAEFLRSHGVSDALAISRGTGVYIDAVESILRVYPLSFRQVGQNEVGEETWTFRITAD